jgi:Damage-control phosphatase ARMT1-like domain
MLQQSIFTFLVRTTSTLYKLGIMNGCYTYYYPFLLLPSRSFVISLLLLRLLYLYHSCPMIVTTGWVMGVLLPSPRISSVATTTFQSISENIDQSNRKIFKSHFGVSSSRMTTNRLGSTSTSTSLETKTSNPLPLLSIPEPICSNIPGTWAYDTMTRRVNDEILQRTIEDCSDDFESPTFQTIQHQFQLLRNELRNASSTVLTHLTKPIDYETNLERQKEYNEWYNLLDPFIQKNDTWLATPWLITEFYVYRRLMDVLQYWTPNTPGYHYDPFIKSKRNGLISSIGSTEVMLSRMFQLLPDSIPSSSSSTTTTTTTTTEAASSRLQHQEAFDIAIQIALWGNKMDLSLWPADTSNSKMDVFSTILEKAHENLLHDDTTQLSNYCQTLYQKGGGIIDIIIDNAGFELITDLTLGQYLIQSGIAKIVTFQLKSHPTFVSDALEKDLIETIEYFQQQDPMQYPAVVQAGHQWEQLIQNGQFQCHEDNFWVQPYAMWDMTEPLRTDLQQRCDLVFVKGDANYRRLLGDRKWEYHASFRDVVGSYFPCPICALRTLKAEIGCGMIMEQTNRAAALDPNWMTNGRFGVIQFGSGAKK